MQLLSSIIELNRFTAKQRKSETVERSPSAAATVEAPVGWNLSDLLVKSIAICALRSAHPTTQKMF